MKKAFFLLFAFTVVAVSASAQDSSLYVYGTVRERSTLDSIPFPTVQFSDLNSNEPPSPVVTKANGRYEFSLPTGKDYKISYASDGHITRWVEIDLSHVPPGFWDRGFAMNIDMVLPQEMPGVDIALFKEPIGRARYDSATKLIAWDNEYTKQMKERLDKFFKEHDQGH